jgi:PAS domain S-box-containing protein
MNRPEKIKKTSVKNRQSSQHFAKPDHREKPHLKQTLSISNERYCAIVDNIPALVCCFQPNGTLTFVNKAYCRYFNTTAAELIGKNFFQFIPRKDRKDVKKHFSSLTKRKPVVTYEHKVLASDGTQCWQQWTDRAIFDQTGKAIGYQSIGYDTTEHRQAEEILKQYQFMVESAQDAIFFKDLKNRYVIANNKTLYAFGLPREQVIGKSDDEIMSDKKEARQNIQDDKIVFKTGKIREITKRMTSADGREYWFQAIKVPRFDNKGNVIGLVGIARDITNHKHTEQELQKVRGQLEIRVEHRTADFARANKELRNEIRERKKAEQKLLVYQQQLRSLASELSLAEERLRRRIATNVHDHIGQTLAISKIKLESLAESTDSPELRKSLDEIRTLIAETIKSSRSLTFELSPPVLYELGFEAVVEWLVRQARQQHSFSIESADDGQAKPLDSNVRVLLFQAVRELLINVAKHAQARNVTVSTRRVNNQIRISVKDDGIGFKISEVNSRDYKTGGFGLFSIKERLGYIGGHLDVESRPGRGTTVTLAAPINRTSNQQKDKG